MALRSPRIAAFLAQFKAVRAHMSPQPPSSISAFPFSTLDIPGDDDSSPNRLDNQSTMDERRVLNELADLLPIRHKASTLHTPTESSPGEQTQPRAVDGFLSPEEKLRGVFLQNLRGKTAIERSLTNVDVDLNMDVLADVVNRGYLGGEAMVTFFRWAIEQPAIPKCIDSYHIVLKALGRRKFFTYMVELLHDMKMQDIRLNSDTIFIVMDSFVRARRVSKALQFFGQLEEFGSKCDTESLNVLLKCLCRRSHVGIANSFLSRVKGKIPFSRATYNVIICGWSRFGRVREMQGCLKAMVEDGFDPDCSTFSYLLEGLGRAGQIDDAVEIFGNLEEKWCASDTAVYNAMISNYVAIGELDECMKYYELMLSKNCEPNADTYTRLIGAFLKARRVADAIEVFDEMLDRGIIPTTGTITSFIEPLCTYGPPHAALLIYSKAKKVGCKMSLNAYKLLLMRLSRFGKCGMMLNLWNEMRESGFSSDVEVYELVINGLCNIGQLENAALVTEESLSRGFCPNKLICSKLNNKLMASNKVGRAYKLLLKIKDARRGENARKYWRAKGWHL